MEDAGHQPLTLGEFNFEGNYNINPEIGACRQVRGGSALTFAEEKCTKAHTATIGGCNHQCSISTTWFRRITTSSEGSHVAIAAFDSGPLKLTPEEIEAGWTDLAGIAVSPKIESRIDLPIGEYDEWYVFGGRPKPFEPTDTYVNCALELRDPGWKEQTADPSWDRVGIRAEIETIRERQTLFWSDIDRIRPKTMIMDGTHFVLVTRDSHVAKAVVDIA